MDKQKHNHIDTPARAKHSDRPAVVVVMGHIDHGKSALLDYIRKTNVVEHEAGSITQHLSAYEVIHTNQSGQKKKITFLDTPGHEAFRKMRSRGATVADIAILVVSAEEGVKAQTLEALESITKSGIPFIVAINKIDKPEANIERTKTNLTEHKIYLEKLGGDVPWVPISAKTGQGISELLDMVLLIAELEELHGNPQNNASGTVIESHRDTKKGISATLIIKDGVLKTGMYIVVGDALAPVRIMEDFLGNSIMHATFSSPVKVVGFNSVPSVGILFSSFASKKEGYSAVSKNEKLKEKTKVENKRENAELIVMPIILKADVLGSLEAIKHEIDKHKDEIMHIKIIQEGVGNISENDIKAAGGKEGTIVLGFNVKTDTPATDMARRHGITIQVFDIIYKLSEWLAEEIKKRKPKTKVEKIVGSAQILKTFSTTKNKQLIGGKVTHGVLSTKGTVRIMRKGEIIGTGTILSIQQHKAEVKKVDEGNEFGAQVNSKIEIARNDVLEHVSVIEK